MTDSNAEYLASAKRHEVDHQHHRVIESVDRLVISLWRLGLISEDSLMQIGLKDIGQMVKRRWLNGT